MGMVNKKAIKYTSEYLPNNNYFEKLELILMNMVWR